MPVHGSLRGAATGFAEGLVASDAEVLASYQHPHLGRWAAVTTKPAGAGRVTVVGTVPAQNLAADLVRWLIPHAVGGWTTDDSVTVSTSTDTSAATRVHVLHNWSWDEATASPSCTMSDILSGERHLPGEKITFRAWDVRLFRSDEAHDHDPAHRREVKTPRLALHDPVVAAVDHEFRSSDVGGGIRDQESN
jgi:beta-galactosidase